MNPISGVHLLDRRDEMQFPHFRAMIFGVSEVVEVEGISRQNIAADVAIAKVLARSLQPAKFVEG